MVQIGIQMNPALKAFYTEPRRFKILLGGRGGGKSQFVALCMLLFAMIGKKILCMRETQASIDDSVKALMESLIFEYSLPGFDIQKKKIFHESGGEILFEGLERKKQAVKSIHGVHYVWCEEAQTLSKESIKILTPSIRAEGSEIWFTANQGSVDDAFSVRFIENAMSAWSKDRRIESDELHMRRHINYDENPWFPDVLETERAYDRQHMDEATYDHVWNGDYADSIDNQIIRKDWILSCIDSHEKLGITKGGLIVSSHDPADSGDARAWSYRRGIVVEDVKGTTSMPVNDACFWSMEQSRGVHSDAYIWDADGMGLGLKYQIEQYFGGGRVDLLAFRGGSGVEDPDHVVDDSNKYKVIRNRDAYYNLRSQCYARLRDRIYNTHLAVTEDRRVFTQSELISFSSNITELKTMIAELSKLPQVYNSARTFQLMRKDEMRKKLKLKSPNFADVVMMQEMTVNAGRKSRDRLAKIRALNGLAPDIDIY